MPTDDITTGFAKEPKSTKKIIKKNVNSGSTSNYLSQLLVEACKLLDLRGSYAEYYNDVSRMNRAPQSLRKWWSDVKKELRKEKKKQQDSKKIKQAKDKLLKRAKELGAEVLFKSK